MKPQRRRQIEREFGVPVAGEILDPSQWTQTALKKLPATCVRYAITERLVQILRVMATKRHFYFQSTTGLATTFA